MRNKLRIGLLALAVGFFAVTPPVAAKSASPSPNPNYGIFRVKVNLGTQPPTVPPELDSRYIEQTSSFTLSDDTHRGTFVADFTITQLDKPAFDTFSITNNTSSDMVIGYINEDVNVQPANPNRQLSELLWCYNALCDSGTYSPAGSSIPPVPLGTISPHSTMGFKVGLKLAPTANRAAWDGTGLTTTLYFGKVF